MRGKPLKYVKVSAKCITLEQTGTGGSHSLIWLKTCMIKSLLPCSYLTSGTILIKTLIFLQMSIKYLNSAFKTIFMDTIVYFTNFGFHQCEAFTNMKVDSFVEINVQEQLIILT